jgi:hypothetical protein
MKTHEEVERQLHHFEPRLHTEVCGQLHAPTALPLGTEPPQFRDFLWLDEPSTRHGEDTNSLTRLGIEPRFLGLPVRSPVIIFSALSRLPYIAGPKYFQIHVKIRTFQRNFLNRPLYACME